MNGARRPVLVWDPATRLFHWLAAALVGAEYVTWRLNWMNWHAYVGYGLLALLFFRLFWGFFGSETARFASFLAAPRTAAQYLIGSLRREPDRHAGHNPAGGWMVLLLLALLFAETLTGLYVNNDVAVEGPLTELTPAPVANAITNLHAILWNALLGAVALHLLAILLYAVAKGHNLLLPMITGKKMLPAGARAPRIAGPARALLLLAGGGIAAAVLVNFL